MNVRTVPCYEVTTIGDFDVANEIAGFEPGREYIKDLLTRCPFLFSEGEETSLPFNEETFGQEPDDATHIERLSPIHVRSFEVRDAALPDIWTDEHGNPYTSLNVKGNNATLAALTESAGSSERYTAYGLQESAVLGRVARVSALLREAGVGTEYLLGLSEPTYFPRPLIDGATDAHERTTLKTYKDGLILDKWNKLAVESRTPEKLVEMQGQLTRETFMVSARAMDTSIRMIEIADPKLRAELFTKFNEHYILPGQKPFDATDPADTIRFLAERTLPFAASNLAKTHALGIACKYPYEQNITAFGSLIDTDSFYGEPLDIGDEPITVNDMYYDLLQIFTAINRSITAIGEAADVIELTQIFISAYRMQFSQSKNEKTLVSERDIAAYAMSQLPDDFTQAESVPQMESYIFANLVTTMFEDLAPYDIENENQMFEYWLECNTAQVFEILDTAFDSLSDNLMSLVIQDYLEMNDPDTIDLEDYLFDEHNAFNFQSVLGGTLHVACRVLLLDEYAKTLHQEKQSFARKALCYSLWSSDSLSDIIEKVVIKNKDRFLQSVAGQKFTTIAGSKDSTIADYLDLGGLLLATQSFPLEELYEKLHEHEIHEFTAGIISEDVIIKDENSEESSFVSAKYEIPLKSDTQWIEVITDSGLLDTFIHNGAQEYAIVELGPSLSYFAIIEWDKYQNPPTVLIVLRSRAYKTQFLTGDTGMGLAFVRQFLKKQEELFDSTRYFVPKKVGLDKNTDLPKLAA